MRFLVHPTPSAQDSPELHRGYISGFDQSVHPTRVELRGNILACRRQSNESGKFHVPWAVAGFGRPMLSTASLPEREEPYLLALELARGKIVQLRNQCATWEGAGMHIPAAFHEASKGAHRAFADAVARQHDLPASGAAAQAALEAACRAAEILLYAYTEQSLAGRLRRFSQIPTLLGCGLAPEPPASDDWETFTTAFNTALVPIEWRVIEPVEGEYNWDPLDALVTDAIDSRLVVRGGPLLDFAPEGLPSWLGKWEHDIWNLQSFVCDFVETVLRRYAGKVRMWEIAARGNTGGALMLSEEHRLTLVAKGLEIARNLDEEAQLFVRVDQPWGEYQARGQHKLSALQFCDALVRSNLGLSGINLEIAVGYRPRGTQFRDLLDFSRLIDLWSGLGLPLQITLAFPAGRAGDLQATVDLEVDHEQWREGWSPEMQAEWVEQLVPLLIAKASITGIFWTHFSDRGMHGFPLAGLLDAAGRPRPALQVLRRLREDYLR